MHPYLKYFLLLFVSFGLLFAIVNVGLGYLLLGWEDDLAGAILTTAIASALFAGMMLNLEVRGLKAAGGEQPGWADLGGDYGEELSLSLSIGEVIELLGDDPRLMIQEEGEPGTYQVLNRVYGHYGKHRTYLTVMEDGADHCILRLDNRSGSAYQLSDLGHSRKQYEMVKSTLLQASNRWLASVEQ